MKKIIWISRYSSTDKPDNLGRWARVGYLQHRSKDPFKNCQIAWINKLNNKYSAYIYLGSGKFKNEFNTEELAKEYCEKTINEFAKEYL